MQCVLLLRRTPAALTASWITRAIQYAWNDKLRAVWPVTLMCRVLGVSVSGFFEHQQRNGKTPPAGSLHPAR